MAGDLQGGNISTRSNASYRNQVVQRPRERSRYQKHHRPLPPARQPSHRYDQRLRLCRTQSDLIVSKTEHRQRYRRVGLPRDMGHRRVEEELPVRVELPRGLPSQGVDHAHQFDPLVAETTLIQHQISAYRENLPHYWQHPADVRRQEGRQFRTDRNHANGRGSSAEPKYMGCRKERPGRDAVPYIHSGGRAAAPDRRQTFLRLVAVNPGSKLVQAIACRSRSRAQKIRCDRSQNVDGGILMVGVSRDVITALKWWTCGQGNADDLARVDRAAVQTVKRGPPELRAKAVEIFPRGLRTLPSADHQPGRHVSELRTSTARRKAGHFSYQTNF